MNKLLHLKGRFISREFPGNFGPKNLKKNEVVKYSDILKIRNDLYQTNNEWKDINFFDGIIVSVFYKTITPKSNRISRIFHKKNSSTNDLIVGVKYNNTLDKHIITYFVPKNVFMESLIMVDELLLIVKRDYNSEINYADINLLNSGGRKINSEKLSKTSFIDLVIDVSHIEEIRTEKRYDQIATSDILVDLYKTNLSLEDLLKKVGISDSDASIFGETTVKLTKKGYGVLLDVMPYIVSMSVTDISKLNLDNTGVYEKSVISIRDPKDEPTIGVFDTLFDDKVYFSKWVEYHQELVQGIEPDKNDYEHGTSIDSIIVDGVTLNKKLDDGCGNFRVRHFGIAKNGNNSIFNLLSRIKRIVNENRDIKVWNFSLGSSEEISNNFISFVAAELDKIQYNYDVVFIISGTNDPGSSMTMKVGSPADSINSIVVNSVDFNGKPEKYSRKGPVLSFFQKPDISYYGGSFSGKKEDGIRVCTGLGEEYVSGTSFAAPWISRKMAFLIQKMGFTREVAKALLIDSAAKWKQFDLDASKFIGYGVVPISIKDILECNDNEIRFVISGISEKYCSYLYNLPVPKTKDGYPYLAKLTMTYYPCCFRNQGVDYTSTELNIAFGRLNDKDKIDSINNNTQDIEGTFNYESVSRKYYRKWDNVKHIVEKNSIAPRARKYYQNKMWGISITSKERISNIKREDTRFGIVITFKEINGVNRIDDFIQQCLLKGWIVETIDIDNTLKLFEKVEQDIKLE